LATVCDTLLKITVLFPHPLQALPALTTAA
jgi:hypothetical protein